MKAYTYEEFVKQVTHRDHLELKVLSAIEANPHYVFKLKVGDIIDKDSIQRFESVSNKYHLFTINQWFFQKLANQDYDFYLIEDTDGNVFVVQDLWATLKD